MIHALIVGRNGTGKTTLIRRVLQALQKPVFGYETVKEDALADAVHGSPIYIYEAGKTHIQSPENLVGYCQNQKAVSICAGFERFAQQFSVPAELDCIIEMDEIGFLESQSPQFRDLIFSLLDSSRPVIAAVRDKNTSFLQAVRSHPKARCFFITPENQDALFQEVLEFMNVQLEDLPCRYP